MADQNPQGKRALIEKANTSVVVISGVAAFIVMFCMVTCKLLISQMGYQSRVIDAKSAALNQLKTDASATKQLITSYQSFVNTSQNVLGGNPTGNGSQDGNNAKIILDALPSQYDFPALATTLEKILSGQTTQSPAIHVQISSISGSDQELSQESPNAGSAAVPMPFQISVTGDYTNIQNVINVFEHSIRPFQFQTVTLSGSQAALSLTFTAQTFYQPGKQFTLTTKVVK